MISSSARLGFVLGTILQLIMVVSGHFIALISALFGPIGLLISLIAGFVYAIRAGRDSWENRLLGGIGVGGLCALVGIALSWLLGDVPALVMIFGTVSSGITGAIGAAIGQAVVKRRS